MHRCGVHPTKRESEHLRRTKRFWPTEERSPTMLTTTPFRRTPVRNSSRSDIVAGSRATRTRRWVMVGIAASAAAALTALTVPVGAAPAPFPTGVGVVLNAPIVDVASTPGGHGYWEGASDGGVFAFGDAGFYGSAGTLQLNQSIVGMASTPDGRGYWEVGNDGGIFAFGDAQFHGSTGGLRLNQPFVGIASTPDGGGYWTVAADGGIFAFGDAGFYGSASGLSPNSPIVGVAPTPDGRGYWEAAANGAVFAFGDAGFGGRAPFGQPVVGISAGGTGYRLVASDGAIYTFGGAGFYGSLGGSTVNAPQAPGSTTGGTGVTDHQRAAWDRVNICEQGGRWNVHGSLFSGGLGFSHANWSQLNTFGFPASAADATPDQQIRVAVAFATRYWGNPDAAPDQHGCCLLYTSDA